MTDPHTDPIVETAASEAPATGTAPVPQWFWILFVAVVFLGALFLGMNSGGFSADIFNPSQVSWAGGGAAAGPPDPKVVGKRIFTQNCVVCHQSSGEGVAGQFPPLAGSEWVLGGEWHGDNHLVRVVLHGLQGPVQVKGGTYNNAMVPWKDVLNDDQIAAVLTFIRSEWGNNADPITAEYVAKVRAETADRGEPWTQKDLQTIGKELVSQAAANPAPEEGAAGEAVPPAEGTEPPVDGATPPETEPAPAAPAGA